VIYLVFTNDQQCQQQQSSKTSLPEFSVAKAWTEMEIAPKMSSLQIVLKFLFENKIWKRMFSRS